MTHINWRAKLSECSFHDFNGAVNAGAKAAWLG